MAPKIYLIRHAESSHNVSKDFSHRDPPLTANGTAQAAQLVSAFPNPGSIAVILSSPLTRAIQTTLAAFPHVLDRRYYPGKSGAGVDGGVELVLDPDLQERSALPCDTGSKVAILKEEFPGLEVGELGEEWLVKEGEYSAEDRAVEDRARRARQRLGRLVEGLDRNNNADVVVVVTHGVFMKFLSQDQDIDLPKAGWRAYTIVQVGSGEWRLIAADDSESENAL